jgi:hypothetical protein
MGASSQTENGFSSSSSVSAVLSFICGCSKFHLCSLVTKQQQQQQQNPFLQTTSSSSSSVVAALSFVCAA